MSTNPYKPTAANLDQVEPDLTVPEDIAKKIKSGWIAGLASISFTMAFILWSFFGTEIIMWMDAGAPTGWPMAFAFMWFFYQGVAGTFQYHRWKRDTQTV
jgi:hypothetical protein